MLGNKKVRQDSLFAPMRRETKVSRELKWLKEQVSFESLRRMAKDRFADGTGRPSIPPEVLGAMMLLGFWFNIPSDRELCEECEDRLSFREFIGLSDEDEVPVHSSLTHWRKRLGREAFREFLHQTVEVCAGVGLKPGRCRMFDSSLVKAQADAGGKSRIDIDPVSQTNDYLEALGEWEDAEPIEPETAGKSEGKKQRASSQSKHGGRRKKVNKRKLKAGKPIAVSANDVDAKLLSRPGKKTDFFHKCHLEFDSKTGIALNADAEHLADDLKMVEFLSVECLSHESRPMDTVVADTGYFAGGSQRWLKSHGLTSLISVRDNSNNGGRVFGLDAFVCLPSSGEYVCPAGLTLTRQGVSSAGEVRYATPRGSCVLCEFREQCFCPGHLGSRRQLTLSADREMVEEARQRNLSNRYFRLKVKRSIVCEGGIAAMKRYNGLGRARGIGEESMAIQAMMSAAAFNLKKALKFARLQGDIVGSACICGLMAILRGFSALLSHFYKCQPTTGLELSSVSAKA